MNNILSMEQFVVDKKTRTLTDADVEAIAEALKGGFMEDFYSDLGKGVFGIVKKLFYIMLIAMAAYGASKGIRHD